MANELLRWGIIGPGRIAEKFAEALNVVDGADLYAVASTNTQRAKDFARIHGAPVCHKTYRALVEDPNVDAIYIATPHRFHFEHTRECLIAGKPVLCEKPLTVNAAETKELIRLSQTNGVFLMEAMWTRYLPIYQRVKEWLEAGRIGSVIKVTSSLGFEFPRDKQDRLFSHELAGGALLDLGVYNLSMSQWVFAAQPIDFTINGFLGNTRVDESDQVLLNYGNGRSSDFTISLNQELSNNLTIVGSRGKIVIDAMFWDATTATLRIDRPSRVQAKSLSVTQLTVTEAFRENGFEYEIEAAVDCIQHGRIQSQRMPHDETLATMKLMDQLREAIGLSYSFETPDFRPE